MSYPDNEHAKALRAGLARQLVERGDIRTPAWEAAVTAVPRHVFVPAFERRTVDGWETVTERDQGYLEAVYTDQALMTQLIGDVPTSSSSQPSLMLRMLEALDVEPGNRVAEIATGTGYNAALLSERLGSRNVFTVEVDRTLARAAEIRLRACGYTPSVVTADGRKGYVAGAPYDRLVATCAFSSLPHAWIQQVRAGGAIVCPLGRGNARLEVDAAGRAEGRFLAGGSYFMTVREEGSTGGAPYPGEPSSMRKRAAGLDPAALDDELFGFVVSLSLPEVTLTPERDTAGRTHACVLWGPDGSWAHVEGDGVAEAGPRSLWDAVERAHAWFEERGRPQRDRFGVTVTPEAQHFWLDTPAHRLP